MTNILYICELPAHHIANEIVVLKNNNFNVIVLNVFKSAWTNVENYEENIIMYNLHKNLKFYPDIKLVEMIYKFCVKKDEKILVIGDNIRTDIKGANNMKFDSLFITNGVHKHEFLHLPLQNYDKILEKYGTKTNFYQERLIW